MQETAAQEPQFNLQEWLAIARRRLWLIVVPLLLGPALGYLGSLQIKPVFSSLAFVLVEQQKVPDAFVPSMVTDQLETRLMTMQDEILSRSRLEPIIKEFGLYKDEKRSLSMDEQVSRLRKNIKVTPIRPDNTNALRGFYVEARATSPRTAQQICERVLSMFMDQNLKARSDRAESTTEFLAGQLQEAKRKLDENDAKLAGFKSKYIGRLPSDEQTNLQMLTSLNTRLDAVNESLSQAQQQRAMQASMLAQQTGPGKVDPTDLGRRGDLERKISELHVQLTALEARYTAEAPDVIKIRTQIQTLQQQLDKNRKGTADHEPEAKTTAPESVENAQLRSSLVATDETIRLKKVEQARLEQQTANFQARIQLSPLVEEQYKGLTRDYESALQFYSDLLTKKTQSEMVRDLEQKREGEQFRVMDAPALPTNPSSPNRNKFALAGLIAGIALGAGLAGILEMKERFIRTETDVETHLGIPLLGVIHTLDLK